MTSLLVDNCLKEPFSNPHTSTLLSATHFQIIAIAHYRINTLSHYHIKMNRFEAW